MYQANKYSNPKSEKAFQEITGACSQKQNISPNTSYPILKDPDAILTQLTSLA